MTKMYAVVNELGAIFVCAVTEQLAWEFYESAWRSWGRDGMTCVPVEVNIIPAEIGLRPGDPLEMCEPALSIRDKDIALSDLRAKVAQLEESTKYAWACAKSSDAHRMRQEEIFSEGIKQRDAVNDTLRTRLSELKGGQP